MAPIEALQPAVEFVVNNGEWIAGLLVVAAVGLNFQQRRALKDRDDNRCQAENKNIQHGGRLEVDHIIPKNFAEEALKMTPEEYNHPHNLLTKCVAHHRGHPDSHHPDMHRALDAYHTDTESIAKAVRKHDAMSKAGVVYWNNENDGKDRKKAKENTKKEDEKRGGRSKWWPF